MILNVLFYCLPRTVFPQSGLCVPGNHPVLVDGLHGVSVELDAVEEVFDQPPHQHLRLRQPGARRLLGHRLEVAHLLEAAQQEGREDGLGVDVVGVAAVVVGAEVVERGVVRVDVLLALGQLRAEHGVVLGEPRAVLEEELDGALRDGAEGEEQQRQLLDPSLLEHVGQLALVPATWIFSSVKKLPFNIYNTDRFTQPTVCVEVFRKLGYSLQMVAARWI